MRLRFIEKDGKRILQELDQFNAWQDVPFIKEQKSITINDIDELLKSHMRHLGVISAVILLSKDSIEKLKLELMQRERNPNSDDPSYYKDQLSWITPYGEVIIKEEPNDSR